MAKKKKKSNWYIYVIAFVFTFGVIIGAVFLLTDLFKDKATTQQTNSDNNDNTQINSSHNLTFLTMISDEYTSAPHTYFIVSYKAATSEVNLVAIPADLKVNDTEDIGKAFLNRGATALVNELNTLLGIEIKHYIHTTPLEFTNMYSSLNKVEINVSKEMTVKASDTGDELKLTIGKNTISAVQLNDYLVKVRNEVNSFEYMRTIAYVLADVLNLNTSRVGITDIEVIYRRMLTTAKTDMDMSTFDFRRHAINQMITKAENPFSYYVPNGEYKDNQYVITDSSKSSIQQRVR